MTAYAIEAEFQAILAALGGKGENKLGIAEEVV
jgi:hypothetical protein